ncbi:MAG TPA: hypothetical protein V6D11_04685 [Waterburya sp.]|jgi:hypothetical protein
MKKKVTLAAGENKLMIAVSNATSIEIINADERVIGSVKSETITAPQIFYIEEGEYRIVTDGHIDHITKESATMPSLGDLSQLVLTSDAKDFHVVDGVGEIPADGQSFTTITIQKFDAKGQILHTKEENDEVFLRTNAGTIKDGEGNEIRSLKLAQGKGFFRLYSEEHKRVATVKVISANPYLTDASISIEFF